MTTTRALPARPCIARRPGLTGYTVDHCRCETCSRAHHDYGNRRDRLIAYGRWEPLVDAEPVRRHIRELMAAGYGYRTVADIANVPHATVDKLLYDKPGRRATKRLRPHIAAALLAVQPEPDQRPDNQLIDGTGTRRRVGALASIGWSVAFQAARLGREQPNFRRIFTTEQVTAGTARAVAALYDELSLTPAPAGQSATRARNWAAKQGWPPPLAWDDATIDDPTAQPQTGGPADEEPDDVAVVRLLAGELRFRDAAGPDRLEAVRRLLAHQYTVSTIATKLRISGTTARRLIEQVKADQRQSDPESAARLPEAA